MHLRSSFIFTNCSSNDLCFNIPWKDHFPKVVFVHAIWLLWFWRKPSTLSQNFIWPSCAFQTSFYKLTSPLASLSSCSSSVRLSFLPAHRALTMSPEQFQYIWRKTIPHIEVGMGSGVFTSHRSARFVLIGDWWTRRKSLLETSASSLAFLRKESSAWADFFL